MKKIFVILCLVLGVIVSGCADNQKNEISFVSISGFEHNETFDYERNISIDKLIFFMENNRNQQIICDLIVDLENSTDKKSQNISIGLFNPNQKRKITLNMEMLEGSSDIDITPECRNI